MVDSTERMCLKAGASGRFMLMCARLSLAVVHLVLLPGRTGCLPTCLFSFDSAVSAVDRELCLKSCKADKVVSPTHVSDKRN